MANGERWQDPGTTLGPQHISCMEQPCPPGTHGSGRTVATTAGERTTHHQASAQRAGLLLPSWVLFNKRNRADEAVSPAWSLAGVMGSLLSSLPGGHLGRFESKCRSMRSDVVFTLAMQVPSASCPRKKSSMAASASKWSAARFT